MNRGDGRVVVPLLRAGLVTPWSIDIQWEDDVAATGWRVRQIPGPSRYSPTGRPFWRANSLKPETMYEFQVVAVDDDHAESSAAAIIHVATVSEGPADGVRRRPGPAVAGSGFEPPTFRL